MSDTAKKYVFYFNGFALAVSYLFLSILLSVGSVRLAPDGLKAVLGTILKPFEFLINSEVASSILYLISIALPIIASVLTVIFLRKELSKRTVCLLSFSFILPVVLIVAAFVLDSLSFDYGFLFATVYSLLLLAYGITTLVFMHKDNNELDW